MKLNAPLELSEEFKAVLDQLENTKENYFITGRAGTGKSTLLQVFRNTTRKRLAVLAPTGIAALNVKGQTIHSFFGFPPMMINRNEIKRRRNFRMYQNVDAIIIDEISMVRADVMDNIDIFLRINRNINEPFGGVQMIFFGDLFQLPPVVASDFEKRHFASYYDSPYFFSSDIVNSDFEFTMIELHQVYRQDERRFINLLDNIRLSHFDYDDLEEINSRYLEEMPEDRDYYITLTSRNNTAEQINVEELKKLETEPFTFAANVTGSFNPRLFPTDPVLTLREGAQVMFLKNDPEKRFVNGSIGIVQELSANKVVVSVMDDYETKSFELDRWEWEIIKYKNDPDNIRNISTDVVGTFKQYPIKLAWAITIHKSQGKTFDRVIIDLGGGAFEYGQTYVALSRCRSLHGIILKNPIKGSDIRVDRRVADFYEMKKYYS